MRKLLVFVVVVLFFASCDAKTEEGVVINGVRWATSNVDAPGTFASNPEDLGMLFQWNRQKGWNAIDEEVEGWNSTRPEGTTWYKENDPCPEGWRVPTREELTSLNNANSRWTTRNGVNGYLFGVAPRQIFLPAAGQRLTITVEDTLYIAGTLNFVDRIGSYWSSTSNSYTHAWGLLFNSMLSTMYAPPKNRASGNSIRCVAK